MYVQSSLWRLVLHYWTMGDNWIGHSIDTRLAQFHNQQRKTPNDPWSSLVHGYGSIPINTIFSGMNIHLPAILMFTRGTRFWHTATWIARCFSSLSWSRPCARAVTCSLGEGHGQAAFAQWPTRLDTPSLFRVQSTVDLCAPCDSGDAKKELRIVADLLQQK